MVEKDIAFQNSLTFPFSPAFFQAFLNLNLPLWGRNGKRTETRPRNQATDRS